MKQVVLLAGGRGTRMQSVARGLPKSLIPVAGKPFLSWQLERLKDCGIQEVVLCLGVGADEIETYVGDGRAWNLRVVTSREDPACLLGTGGALVQAMPLLRPVFGVLYGDSYLPMDFLRPFSLLEKSPASAVMCVFLNRDQWVRSNVRVEGNRVSFYSKSVLPGEADTIDYGFSVFRKEVLADYIGASMPLDLSEVIRPLVQAHQLMACWEKERFYEIGSPAGWRELNKRLIGNTRRAIFLDRDGTLNEMVFNEGGPDSPMQPDSVRLLPGVARAMVELRAMGYFLVVVTNQPGVAKGTLDVARLEAIHQRLADLLQQESGAKWDALLYCPHHPSKGIHPEYSKECSCRKPKPGLLLEAARLHGIDLANSWMVGDRLVDVEAGKAAGCRSIWLAPLPPEGGGADFVVSSLADVPDLIREKEWNSPCEEPLTSPDSKDIPAP